MSGVETWGDVVGGALFRDKMRLTKGEIRYSLCIVGEDIFCGHI